MNKEHHHHHRYEQSKKATLFGALKNTVLGVLKVILGFTGHSHALVADGFHSFADLLTDMLVLLASHWGAQEADSNHPYGHQRIETAGSMLLAFLLILAGIVIAYEAILHFIGKQIYEDPQFYVVIVAAISALLNEILFQYTRYTAKNIKSDLLMANAWHHRSDAFSSLVVLVGVVGSVMGFFWLDSLAALIVGIMIIKMGVELAWSSISELVDTSVESDILENISQIISQTKGVQTIHQLRTRSMGGGIFVDVHILVDMRLSVSEGHYIADLVYKNLMKNIENMKDVTVHVDSEDDIVGSSCFDLPAREELFDMLKEHSDFAWEKNSSEIILHYLDGKVYLDIYGKFESKDIPALLKNIPLLGGISVYEEKENKK